MDEQRMTGETGDKNAVIDQKLRQFFDGKIVRKDLTKKIKEGANVPVYVLEFLLGQYINTASGVSKIFIQIFAVVAEFERDTLTERITDNMMELAKDGRWLGGNTPTGFTVKRVKTGSGKNKSAYSYLESIPEEKAMIQKLYEIFVHKKFKNYRAFETSYSGNRHQNTNETYKRCVTVYTYFLLT